VARVFVAFHPRRKTERPLLYEDLIAMNQAGQNASVSKIIEMIGDLRGPTEETAAMSSTWGTYSTNSRPEQLTVGLESTSSA